MMAWFQGREEREYRKEIRERREKEEREIREKEKRERRKIMEEEGRPPHWHNQLPGMHPAEYHLHIDIHKQNTQQCTHQCTEITAPFTANIWFRFYCFSRFRFIFVSFFLVLFRFVSCSCLDRKQGEWSHLALWLLGVRAYICCVKLICACARVCLCVFVFVCTIKTDLQ